MSFSKAWRRESRSWKLSVRSFAISTSFELQPLLGKAAKVVPAKNASTRSSALPGKSLDFLRLICCLRSFCKRACVVVRFGVLQSQQSSHNALLQDVAFGNP